MGGDNNGQRKWNSKISMLEKNVKNQKRHLAVFITVSKPSSDNEDSDDPENE